MVQTFGNRILGGIGAPGGGMSEAFGAGVNTALGQRELRQAMGLRAQDQQFKIEDREEAKRRRAAADAAAAAARAKAAALNEQYLKIYGVGAGGTGRVGGAGLNLNTPAGPGRDRQGAAAPAPAPVATRPPAAGVRIETGPRQSLTYGRVTGGAGSTSVSGGTGEDLLTGVPVVPPSDETAAESISRGAGPVREYVYDQAGNFLGTTDRIIGNIVGAAESVVGLGAGAVGLGASALGYPEFGQTMFDSAGQRFVDAERMAREGYFGANAAAPAATTGAAPTPETVAPPAEVTIQGPNGPVTVAAADTGAMFPTGTLARSQPTPLTFGPRLGAMPQTQEEIMIDDFVRTQPARGTAAPPPPKMGQPGQPGKVITDLLAQRDQHVQWAQALIAAGQYADAQAVQEQIASVDSKLEASVARQAIEEARDYNAPQRLNAIWSEYTARNHEFVPIAPGVFDVYVDGQLQFPGLTMDNITEETLMMSDQAFAQRQADLAARFAEAEATAGGTAAGEAPFEERQATFEAALAVEKEELLAEIAVAKDFGTKENDLRIQRLKELTGLTDANVKVEKTDYGFAIFDGNTGDLITSYMLTQKTNEAGEPFQTYVEVR